MRSKYVSAEFKVYYHRWCCAQPQKTCVWVFPDVPNPCENQLQSGMITRSLFGKKKKKYQFRRNGFFYRHSVPFYPTPAMVKAVQEHKEKVPLSCRILMQMDYSTSGYSSRRKS